MVKVRILRWKNYPGLSKWPNVIIKVLIRRKKKFPYTVKSGAGERGRVGDMMTKEPV